MLISFAGALGKITGQGLWATCHMLQGGPTNFDARSIVSLVWPEMVRRSFTVASAQPLLNQRRDACRCDRGFHSPSGSRSICCEFSRRGRPGHEKATRSCQTSTCILKLHAQIGSSRPRPPAPTHRFESGIASSPPREPEGTMRLLLHEVFDFQKRTLWEPMVL